MNRPDKLSLGEGHFECWETGDSVVIGDERRRHVLPADQAEQLAVWLADAVAWLRRSEPPAVGSWWKREAQHTYAWIVRHVDDDGVALLRATDNGVVKTWDLDKDPALLRPVTADDAIDTTWADEHGIERSA